MQRQWERDYDCVKKAKREQKHGYGSESGTDYLQAEELDLHHNEVAYQRVKKVRQGDLKNKYIY